ncbi:MAG: class I fructose-bisphosphate aldolase [Micavibrio sp.]|nr:class I fructose-bisphosphate aldolase [Micavibrio sp.]
MRVTPEVKKILSHYESDTPAVKNNIARMLMTGKLAGTGKMVILPVDQGFEHGPARSFAINPDAYDPHYHYELAIESGCNAYAAPLGALEAGAETFIGEIPTILKMNSSNSLIEAKDQSVNASVQDAVRLGCAGIGFTVYPGSEYMLEQQEEIAALSEEAKAYGIATVLWSYPRGGKVTAAGETAIDIVAYAAHMAAQLGAHIIKVKLPTDHLDLPEAKKVYEQFKIPVKTQGERVRHIMKSAFNGRRIVVFSGGAAKGEDAVYDDARAIFEGGGNGSIIGRNCFQRPRDESLKMLNKIMDIYLGKTA